MLSQWPNRGFVMLALVIAMSGLLSSARAVDADAAETVMKGKGLTREGAYFVLPEESELPKRAAEIRKSEAEMKKASAELTKAEKIVDRVKAYIAGKELEMRKILDELAKGNIPVERNNQLVAKYKALEDEVKKVTQNELKKFTVDMNTSNDAYVKARQEYIDKAMAALDIGEKADAKYVELAKDDEVTKAMADIETATEKKVALGPTAKFKASYNVVKALGKSFSAEKIELTVENNVSFVDVMINGTTRRSMVVDTGAGMVSIPADLAEALELKPDSKTPQIRLQLADGKIVEAWVMTLKSVQVGAFKIENVECAVLPPQLVAAQPLLGGTFLKHFVVKLDANKKELDLVRIKGAD